MVDSKEDYQYSVILCPVCTEGVTKNEQEVIINILREAEAKLTFEYCREHKEEHEDSTGSTETI